MSCASPGICKKFTYPLIFIPLSCSCKGRSSLHLAAYSGHAEVVSLLLDGGATIDLKDEHGE